MNKKTHYLLLGLALLFQSMLNAQDNKKAEALFENTFPLAFNVGIQTMSYSKSGNSGPFSHNLSNLWMPEFGLTYSFLQKSDFNFSLGFNARIANRSTYLYSWSAETNPLNYQKTSGQELSLHIPLTAEYIFSKKGDTSFAAHLGYELQYTDAENTWPYNISVTDSETGGKISLFNDYYKKNYTHGTNLGVGMYQKLGSSLLKFELNYHIHFYKAFENKLTATKFPNQPDYKHELNWNGNHISVKLTYYPFRRGKKK